MSFVTGLRRLIPQNVKNFLRQGTVQWRLAKLIASSLPPVVCVDVGASHYPHGKWLIFLNSKQTEWLAVEPNQENLGYLRSWNWSAKVSACTTGLSREGGEQTLYVTNVDTGSSLLKPEIPPSMKHRVTNLDYFFPLVEKSIKTITLVDAIGKFSLNAPIFVKLDTQGTELSIIQGAQALFDQRRVVGVEMESTLLAQPLMKGAGKFWQACEYMEQQGFELLHVKPIHASRRSGRSTPPANTFLNECDAVFALRPDVAAELPTNFRMSLLAFYLTNMFYEEALSLMDRDLEVVEFLKAGGCQVESMRSVLSASV